MMAGPVARARGMDRKIAVGTNEFRECPEALSAYQHTKAEAVPQRGGYRFLPKSASGGLPGGKNSPELKPRLAEVT